jgi:hypothetical protein
MKNFDEFLEKEFKKLVPYKPLLATEKASIILANIRWLTQKRQEIEPLFNIYKGTESEKTAKLFFKGMQLQIDKLLGELK